MHAPVWIPALVACGSPDPSTWLLGAGALAILGVSCAAAGVGIARERGSVWRWRWLLAPQIALAVIGTVLAYAGWFSTGILAALLVPGADKVLHFLLMGMLALGAHFALHGRTILGVVPLAVVLPLLVLVLEEALQLASPHRTADLADLACDLAGLLVFWRAGLHLTRGDPS